jgi:hypothetical protein
MKIRELLADEWCWTQGDDTPRVGHMGTRRYCLMDAVHACYNRPMTSPPLSARFWDVVWALRAHTGACISDWNDDPSRTFAEVRALVEKLDI